MSFTKRSKSAEPVPLKNKTLKKPGWKIKIVGFYSLPSKRPFEGFDTMTEKKLDKQTLQRILAIAFDEAMDKLTADDFCLVGTGAAVLQGVVLPTGDIDILVKERATVDKFADALAHFDCLMPPTELETQYYFECNIDGVGFSVSTVEVTTENEFIETYGEGPWKYSTLIPCGTHQIRTVNLELRLATELGRQRPDRYEPLIDWMRTHGCDQKLLVNAMLAWAFPADQIEAVLKQLGVSG
jgi:hypothetical protein